MTVWFTSDHHFGHENIIRFCARPFQTVGEMDEHLIDCWNSVVGHGDEVWHLGDFAYRCGPRRMGEIFGSLNGRRRHLVLGGHDRKHVSGLPWTSVQVYRELKIGSADLILFHYALREWNRSHHGSWSLHGYSHGRLPPANRSCDVGVDCWNYRPVCLEEIMAREAVSR